MAEAPPSPPRKIKLVVSDFHLGKGRTLPDNTQNILEDFIYDREFAAFLEYHRTGEFLNAEVELVLNGDILNLLQSDSCGVHTHLVTERSVVRSVRRIVAGHPEFFHALRRFASAPGHAISYVVGNHDVGMLWPRAQEVFSEAVGAPVRFHDVSYLFDGVHVEHGQQYERFARINMEKRFLKRSLPEPVLNLPIGSIFVSTYLPRIKHERPYIDKVRPFPVFLRWVAIHDFWWGLKTSLSALRFVLDVILFQRRFRIEKRIRAILGVLKEISFYPNFDKVAFKILEEREEVHTVIFGHTHLPRYRQWREGKQYFNEGCWNETTNLHLDDYGKRVRFTYCFVEYPPADASAAPQPVRPKVRLKEWRGVWTPEMDVIA